MIQDSIIKTIQLAIVSQCGQFCNYDGVNLTHLSSGCDVYNVTTIFLISITTSDPEQSAQTYYKLLGKWIITNPALFFSNNRTYQIDSNCAFLVEDTANSLSCDTPTVTPHTSTTQPTSTTTPTSRSTFVEVWIPIVVVIVFLLAVVAIAAIVIVLVTGKEKMRMLL